jgi:hypothetical protein
LVKNLSSGGQQVAKFPNMLLDVQARLIQILALTELPEKEVNDTIREVAKTSLKTIDYYLFAQDHAQLRLSLGPLSASSTVRDVADELKAISALYNVSVATDVTKKLEPMYANNQAVKGAIYGLASTVIANASSVAGKQNPRLIIAAQSTAPNIQRIGVFSPDFEIHSSLYKKTNSLTGSARSVAPEAIHDSGLGLIISQELIKLLGSEIKQFVHRGNKGVGFYIQTSKQLSFI